MSDTRRRGIILIVALTLVLAWSILDRTSRSNPIRDGFSRIVSPAQFALQQFARPLVRTLGKLDRLASLEGENEALRRENESLRNQLILSREAQVENERLRSLLSFKSAVPNLQLLSAEVIGYDPGNILQRFIIDRGAVDKVESGMPVLAADGLVGRISQVSAMSSKVMLITDPSSSVTASIQRSRATGVVQGAAGSALVMRYIPQGDTVTPGDVVLTSGLGGNFPRRLIIGHVVSVMTRDVGMFQEAEVVPAVSLRDIETVMVLLNFVPSELSPETDGE